MCSLPIDLKKSAFIPDPVSIKRYSGGAVINAEQDAAMLKTIAFSETLLELLCF